ncbi:MAG TPA: GAF domain-containing protein [Longimicrobiales bacterium]
MVRDRESWSGPGGGDAEEFRYLADHVREIFWVLDPTGSRALYVNRAYEAVTGRSREQLYRDPGAWREAVHPDDRARVDEIPRLAEHDIEFRIVRPDGDVRWIWTRGTQVRDARGRVHAIVGVAEDITRRKRAEQELEWSLSVLRATLDATADGILAFGLDGRLTVFNRRFVELWQVPESVIIKPGREAELRSWMLDQLRDPAAFEAEVSRVSEHPESNSFDGVEFKDGRVFERYSQPERIGDRVVGRVWSFRDVTARLNAERGHRHRTRRLEVQNEVLRRLAHRRITGLADRQAAFQRITEVGADMLETERVGVWLFEAGRGRIRLCELYQRSARRHSSGTVLARELAPSYFAALEQERAIAADDVHQDPRTRELAAAYCAPLGIASMLDAPIRAGGELMGIVCFEHVGPPRHWTVEDESFAASIADFASIVIEAADHEQAEAHMRLLARAGEILTSSLDFRTTLDNVIRLIVPRLADWCIMDLVEDGRVRRLASAHEMKGKERILRELEQRYPISPDSPQLGAVALRTGEPQLVREMTDEVLRKHAVDEDHLALARALGVRSYLAVPLKARGRTLGVLSFGTTERSYGDDDVTFAQDVAGRAAIAIDNARLHEEAQQASKAKSNFLTVMSHELRTPLTAIMGYTDLLTEGVHGRLSREQQTLLERIRLRSQDLLRTLEEILAYSRTESGREQRREETVDASRLVRDVESIVRPLADERGLAFDVQAPARPVELVTDPDKLKHILLNLLSNAVKFTPRGGIGLELRREGDRVVFRVRDTGQGIVPEHQERIFEPFVQVEDVLTRETGGTGLGLAVARRLARFLGGDVSVESEPGAGSTFTVWLPVEPERARKAA